MKSIGFYLSGKRVNRDLSIGISARADTFDFAPSKALTLTARSENRQTSNASTLFLQS